VSRKTLGACAGVLAAVGIYTFPAGGYHDGARDTRAPSPRHAVAAELRDRALRHARIRLGDFHPAALTASPGDPTGILTGERVTCRFMPRPPSGTSSKFDCVLDNGEVVRVKYKREAEIHAEVAGTHLLAALGYAADDVFMVPRLRCYGCPADPFVTMRVLDLTGGHAFFAPAEDDGEFADFEWVAVERKFDATPIEDETREGWGWWELKDVDAPRAEIDALRLISVFLAHWDNKSDNQRLVCMDATFAPDRPCADPLLMIQDVGATFGPMKVNLARWREMPVWSDPATCAVSMRALPYHGSTFPDARIAEAARVRTGRDLASFTDADLRAWFAAARFPQFYTPTDDEKDLAAWTGAFRHRVDQILGAGPCPQ